MFHKMEFPSGECVTKTWFCDTLCLHYGQYKIGDGVYIWVCK